MSIRQMILAMVFLTASTGVAQENATQALLLDNPADSVAGVRSFMDSVAYAVSTEGPTAWLKYFEKSPNFFMAVDGQVAFRDLDAAKEGTTKFAQTIRHIDLKWGRDLRVDPLTSTLVVIAVPWREIQTDNGGHIIEEHGYFTALIELHSGQWRFRNLHWSSLVSPTR